MNAILPVDTCAAKPPGMHPDEWAARVELAACYRVFAHLGWTEMIYNHITLRLPDSVAGDEKQFLINPFGLHYSEVTARNLVKINLQGEVLDASAHRVNPAGFVVHATLHGGIEGAHCVMHTHTTAGVAVACLKEGLQQTNFYSAQPRLRGHHHPRRRRAACAAKHWPQTSGDSAQPRTAGLGRHAGANFRDFVDPATRLRNPVGHLQHGRSASRHSRARGHCRKMHPRRAAVQPPPRRGPGRIQRPGATGGPS